MATGRVGVGDSPSDKEAHLKFLKKMLRRREVWQVRVGFGDSPKVLYDLSHIAEIFRGVSRKMRDLGEERVDLWPKNRLGELFLRAKNHQKGGRKKKEMIKGEDKLVTHGYGGRVKSRSPKGSRNSFRTKGN